MFVFMYPMYNINIHLSQISEIHGGRQFVCSVMFRREMEVNGCTAMTAECHRRAKRGTACLLFYVTGYYNSLHPCYLDEKIKSLFHRDGSSSALFSE